MVAKLAERVAIVTGGDSGIGQAIAEEFAKEGADIAITYLQDRDGAERTRAAVAKCGQRALVSRTDQRDPAQIARLFEETVRELGVPYILVNNAGVSGGSAPVADLPIEDWDNAIKTDLYGPFYCCQHFIRARRTAGGKGKIINITSVHEEIPMPGAAAYDAAKGGLRNLTRTLMLELAPDHINVNNIAPGMVLTPMNQKALDDPAHREQVVQHIPWKRAAEPWEIAKLAVYLAAEDSDYVTGQSFTIDGGLTLNRGQGA